jgi:LuxR family transcriptional regulator, quorum-sensing system regulator BjaR1
MSGEIFDPGRAAFEFIDEIERLRDQRQVIERLNRELAKYGFPAWVVTGLPHPGGRLEDMMLLNGWSPEWSSYYFKHNLIKDDPVGAHCFRSTGPFEWREAPYDPILWPAAKKIMTLAADVGMVHGFCVPIHTCEGFQAVVSMAGTHVDLSPVAKRALHLMSIYAHAKAVEVAKPACEASPPLLTAREREVLKWTAAGKTVWEISVILNISRKTVDTHLQSIAVKLDTPNKTAAVVSALRRGEIRL